MSTIAWPEDYVTSDGSGLNTTALLSDFKSSTGLGDLTENERKIFDATLEATIWSYPLNETHRLFSLNTISEAPRNRLFKPDYITSWLNKNSTPAPDASVYYMTAWLDLNRIDGRDHGEQVLQLPANPDGLYYILAVLDSYINTNGSLGPRTAAEINSTSPQYILLAGPDSPHYKGSHTTVTIAGSKLNILRIDTPRAWITARFATNTLDAEAMAATRAFINGSRSEPGSGFQITTLKDFKSTGTVPHRRPKHEPNEGIRVEVARDLYGSTPQRAEHYFKQVSEALTLNPIPDTRTNSFQPPAYQVWIHNQNSVQDQQKNPNTIYQPPSALSSRRKNDLNERFAAIGLNLEEGFQQPANWTTQERQIFQESYRFALNFLQKATDDASKGIPLLHHGWHITNNHIGVYPNTWKSWLVRAGAAVEGGAANIPNDAVYPTTQRDSDGLQLTSTYNYRITLPATANQQSIAAYAPAQGFWSFTIYQPNPGNAYQPFLIENAIQNTAYTPIDETATLTADGRIKTSKPPNWNDSTALGTALLTGKEKPSIEGMEKDTIYYVYSAEEVGNSILLKLASDYQPTYSNGIPVGGEGSPTQPVSLKGSAGSTLSFGWINPVAQLGSSQLPGETNATTTLATESDGSINLLLSNLAPDTNRQNWLPTPLVTNAGSGHPRKAHEFEVMARYYWPTEGDPSILDKKHSPGFYKPPAIERLGLNRIKTWDLLSQSARQLALQSDANFDSINPLNSTSPFNDEVVGALLDLRFLPDSLEGRKTTVNYSYSRNADYTNQLFFYAIDDVTGSINGLPPSDSEYLNEAWSRRLQPDAPIVADFDSTSKGSIQLTAGQLFAPIINNGKGQMLTAFDSANARDYRHFDLLSGSSFAFEDLLNGGNEHDRNDGIFTITSIDLSAP
ncbi:conserved hypothetical protein (DUF1254/DUF1214) [Synechococcus sp. RS9909]|uniref:DUF1214 domain-containing protein n=1 Tax=unclassified Synechococcus TaxID=2626047 RepID=UPI0002D8ADA2|nr:MULTISPECIES: DUF1214 domain-containing protein [unclassified Synechococcus]QNI80098.1 conserved hypothetical protein (DUF1254/DUF1214) [Synechococcus sp. RS9909]